MDSTKYFFLEPSQEVNHEIEKYSLDPNKRGTTGRSCFAAWRYLLCFLIGMGIGIALSSAFKPTVGLIAKSIAKTSPTPPTVDVNGGFVFSPETGEAKCGNSWIDAKRLGCRFDVMASRWYSPDCFNERVLNEMLDEVDFKWYADRNHTQEVSRDLVLAGEFEAVYPNNDYHIMHCLYLWRRLHSALIEHRHLDDDVYSYGHTLHCTRLIMRWPKGINSTTIATSGIPYCRANPL